VAAGGRTQESDGKFSRKCSPSSFSSARIATCFKIGDAHIQINNLLLSEIFVL
jgi:hypothetical protein